ncbi:MAG: phosphotransferase [bacterium]|nr:phosphotransferase [bacterium]
MSQQRDGLDTLADMIRGHYELGNVERPQPLAAAHQRRHRKLVVKTDAGTFLVKTYRRDPYVLDALRFQHRLSDHLDKHGLPVARIQAGRDGTRIVEVDDWAMELQQFVDGEAMTVSSKTLAISAEALGKLHEVCRDYPRPPRDARMWRFSEVPRSLFAGLYERAKEENSEGFPVDDYCNQIALFLHEAGDSLNYEARNRFETGLIHGDWHGGNLIFNGERLMAIVDFEFAGDGCYLEDLAYAISNLCVRTTMRPERLTKRTDRLLYHYQRYRSLSWYEETALYYSVGIKHIATVSYQMPQQGGKVAGHTACEWMERLAAQSAWLIERSKQARWGH